MKYGPLGHGPSVHSAQELHGYRPFHIGTLHSLVLLDELSGLAAVFPDPLSNSLFCLVVRVKVPLHRGFPWNSSY